MSTMTLEDLSNHLRKIDFCMLCTTGSGAMATRPMSNNGDVEYDGNSWFFSYDHTSKIAEIEEMDTVMLTFTAPPSLLGKPGIFVSVQGNASIVRDKTKFEEHWRSGLKRWFPEGPQTAGLVLIKVTATSIRFWDGEDNGQISLPTRPESCS